MLLSIVNVFRQIQLQQLDLLTSIENRASRRTTIGCGMIRMMIAYIGISITSQIAGFLKEMMMQSLSSVITLESGASHRHSLMKCGLCTTHLLMEMASLEV